MTSERAQVLIAAITSTLYETLDHWAPASQIYLALGMDIEAYQTIAQVLSQIGLCEVTSDTIRLTSKGMDIGRQLSTKSV